MITTVTLNAAVDRTIEIENFMLGQVNRMQRSYIEAGGKGINVSKVVKSLGGDTLALGFVGGETGKWIEGRLKEMAIKTDFVWVDRETRTNIKIIDRSRRQITDINDQGGEIEKVWLEALCQKIRFWAEYSKVMVFSGSLPPNTPPDIYRQLISIAQEKGCKIILDTDGPSLLEGIKACPYMVKPNIHELADTFGVSFKDEDEVIKCCSNFLAQGIALVVVSMGSKGALMVTKDQAIKAEALEVAVQNTVGAGDAMVGAFAYGIHEGYSLEETFTLASAAAAVSVSHGTTFQFANVIQDYQERIKLVYPREKGAK